MTILSLDPEGWAPPEIDMVAEYCVDASVIPIDPFQNPRWRRVMRFFSLRPLVTRPSREMVEAVKQRHEARPFDVVIAASLIMAEYALVLDEIPQILEEHNSLTRWMMERYQSQRSIVDRARCWGSWYKTARFEKHLYERFDLVTMVSEKDASVARSLLIDGQSPVKVLPNGVDCDYFRPNMNMLVRGRLIYGGALAYEANYEAMEYFLRRVLPIIQKKRPDVHLHITGSFDGANIDLLSHDDHVSLTGLVEDIRTELAAAEVAIVPLLSGGGTRLKILEAMAMGVPVVSTSKGAEGLDVMAGKHLLIADNPADFSRSVLDLLEDFQLRQSLAKEGRRLVEECYDWRQIGREFVAETESLVRGKEDSKR